jgi:hypothetical protein
LRNRKVAEEIQWRQHRKLERLDVKAEHVLENLRRIAFCDVREFFGVDGVPLSIAELPPELATCVSACDALIDYAANFFTDVAVSESQLQSLVLMFVDRIYRFASDLTVKDPAVTTYFSTVTRYVLDLVAARGVRIFYILDNEIREDRFELTMKTSRFVVFRNEAPTSPQVQLIAPSTPIPSGSHRHDPRE